MYMRLLIIIILICLFTPLGCVQHEEDPFLNDDDYEITYDDAGNRIITVDKGIGHFSMLFPDGFKLSTELAVIDKSLLWDNINFWIKKLGVEDALGNTFISININDWGGKRALKSVYENSLKFAESLFEFQLIEESMTTVAAVTAYQFSYYFEDFVNLTHPPQLDDETVTALKREVLFEHDNLIYEIRLWSYPFREEQDIEIFDQVLESFTILD